MSHLNIRVYRASGVAVDTKRKTKRSTNVANLSGIFKELEKRSAKKPTKMIPEKLKK